MRSARDIERLTQDMRLAPSRQADQRILTAAEAALNQRLQERSAFQRPLWRIIMESPITKWTVAAILTLGLLLIAHSLSVEDQPDIAKEHEIISPHDTLLIQEREQAETAYAQSDETTLLMLLEQGQDATQIQVAKYLGQIGTQIALDHLQRLAATESDTAVREAMILATEQIRQRLDVSDVNEVSTTTAPTEANESQDSAIDRNVDNDQEGVLGLRIVDRETGEPLSGCKITIERAAVWELQGLSGITNQFGRYNIDLRDKQSSFLSLSVTKPGYCPLEIHYESRGREYWFKQHNIQMFKGVPVSGRVVDKDQEPMEDFPLGFSTAESSFLERQAYGQIWLGWQYLTLHTDDQGIWHSREMLPGATTVFLKSRHPDFTIAEGLSTHLDSLQAGTHVLTVWPGMTLTGFVMGEQGQPVPGYKVRVENLGSSTGASPRAMTDPNGTFTIQRVNPGELVVVVQAPGFAPARQILNIGPDQGPLEFVLVPGYTAVVQVVDDSGDPISEATVYWSNWPLTDRNRSFNPLSQRLRTDEEGWVVLQDLPANEAVLTVYKGGYVSRKDIAIVPREEPYTVVLKQTGTLSGRVIDEKTRRPIPEFLLFEGDIRQTNGSPFWNDTPVPCVDGQYTIELDTWGKAIRIEANGYNPYVSSTFVNDGTYQIHDIQLIPGQIEPITGTVYLPEGTLAIGAQVIQVSDDQHIRIQGVQAFGLINPRTQTDPNGQFSLPGQFDPFELVFIHEEGFLRLDPSLRESLERIELMPWASVEIHASKEPFPDKVHLGKTFMTMRDNWIDVRHTAEFDANGLAVFAKVPPGPYAASQVKEKEGKQVYVNPQSFMVPAGETYTLALSPPGNEIMLRLVNDRVQDFQKADAKLQTDLDVRELGAAVFSLPEDLLCMTAQEKQQWNEEFLQSEAGQAYMQEVMPLLQDVKTYTGQVSQDGYVQFSEVLPGMYTLIVELSTSDQRIYRYVQSSLELPSRDVDLGEVMLPERAVARVGQPAPDFSLPSQAGSIVRLQDYRGQFILVESGGPMAEMNYIHSVLPYLNQVYQAQSDSGLEIVSLSLWTMSIMDLRGPFDYFVSYYDIPWQILFVELIRPNETPDLLQQYAKKFTLIGPNDRVLMTADTDQAEQLADLVSKAMSEYQTRSP